MNIDPVSRTASVGASSAMSSSSSASSAGMGDMYMQLLMAQLKNQSPLEPLDPNQFVNQLAQFNTLNEIIQIREMLQSLTLPASKSANPSKGAQ